MFIFCARKTHIHLIVLLFLYNLIQKENYYTPGLITVLQKVKLLQLLVWFFLQKFSLCVKVLGNSCARFQFLLVANKTNNFVKFKTSFFFINWWKLATSQQENECFPQTHGCYIPSDFFFFSFESVSCQGLFSFMSNGAPH